MSIGYGDNIVANKITIDIKCITAAQCLCDLYFFTFNQDNFFTAGYEFGHTISCEFNIF